MKILLSIFLLIAIPVFIKAQESIKVVSVYPSTTNYLNHAPLNEKLVPKIISEKSNLLRITKFTLPGSSKRFKAALMPWAISIDSTPYFNMRYSREVQGLEVFVKPDIIGKFCAIFADKETLRAIASSGVYYGGGLTGVLISESTKWGKNWTTESKEKIKIFVLELENVRRHGKSARSGKDAIWEILTEKKFNKLLKLNLSQEEIDALTIEKIRSVIEEKNKTL